MRKPRRFVSLDIEVFGKITAQYCKPFDTPNAALRRMFGLPPVKRGPKPGTKYKKRKREKVPV